MADVCTGSDIFPDGSELPVTLRNWTRTNTASLTDEDTVKIVLKFHELVKTNDWVQLEKVCGIRTNTFTLEVIRQ